jgi:hypothetical protein
MEHNQFLNQVFLASLSIRYETTKIEHEISDKHVEDGFSEVNVFECKDTSYQIFVGKRGYFNEFFVVQDGAEVNTLNDPKLVATVIEIVLTQGPMRVVDTMENSITWKHLFNIIATVKPIHVGYTECYGNGFHVFVVQKRHPSLIPLKINKPLKIVL